MKALLYISCFVCILMFVLGCSSQESQRMDGVEAESSAADTEEFKQINENNQELLASKHYWKLGEQKVQDLVDLLELLSDSTLDESIKSAVVAEAQNLLAIPLDSSEVILEYLRDVKRIRMSKNRTDLVPCGSGLHCFSISFELKQVNGEKREIQIHFILSEESQQFGSETTVIKKVRIESVQDS